jgi:hypothetical protein
MEIRQPEFPQTIEMFQKGCDIGFFADLSMHYFQFIPFTVTDD